MLLLLLYTLVSPMVIRGADAQAGYDGWQASRYAGPAGFVSHMPGLRRNGGPGLCNATGCRAVDDDDEAPTDHDHYCPAGGAAYRDAR